MHTGGVRHLPLAKHETDGSLIVSDRLRVRHRAHGGETADRRGACTSRDRLDVLASRLAQMAVHVDESGRDHESATVDDAIFVTVRRIRGAPEVLDLPVREHEITRGVEILRWIEDSPTAQNDPSRVAVPVPRS